jgi:putative transposase
MDFVADELFNQRRLRLLTIVDDFTRESLAIEVGQLFGGPEVTAVLDRIGVVRGLPERIRVDNGTEFTSKRLAQWAYLRKVKLDFSRRGKPTDNGLIEAFNGRLRAKCLNAKSIACQVSERQLVPESRQCKSEGRSLASALQ